MAQIDNNAQLNNGVMPIVDKQGFYCFDMPQGRAFRVLQLTDIHLGGWLSPGKDAAACSAVKKVVNAAKPDLIIVTGDLIYPIPFNSGTVRNLAQAKRVGALLDGFGIPWTLTFGNHDTESFATHGKGALTQYYSSLPHCFFEKGDAESGMGNFFVRLRKDERTVMALALLDSNMYTKSSFFSGFDVIHDDQIEWYRRKIDRLSSAQGEIVPSLAFFHIPPAEFKEAWYKLLSGDKSVQYHFGEVGECTGKRDDYFGIPCIEGHFFEEMVKLGSLRGLFCGHDHLNTCSLTYRGIRLTYGYSIDYLAYPGIKKRTSQRGGTLIEITAEGGFDVSPIPLESLK